MELLIFSERLSPRLDYTMEVLFKWVLSSSYRITTDATAFDRYAGPRLNYSRSRRSPRELFLPAGTLLFEDRLYPHFVEAVICDGQTALFPQPVDGADFAFDLPAMVFYLISRYEEYLPFAADRHGRFSAIESLAFRKGFLDQPLVNQWALRLADRLKDYFSGWSYRPAAFQFLPTYDVDMPWAIRHRNLFRVAGGGLRSLLHRDVGAVQMRIKVWKGDSEDPFFTFPWMDRLHDRYGLRPRYFFLLAKGGRFNFNPSPKLPVYRKLIRRLQRRYDVGIHPGYAAGDDPALLRREIDRLQEITQQPVTHSRQHYLCFRLPQTYRHLINAGIRHEYSMGFADTTGFRASIATPYPWYDLPLEKTTTLLIHPFQAMDVTLKDYEGLSADAALEKLYLLMERTKKVGGNLITLWHNNSLSEWEQWKGWRRVYEQLVAASA